MSKRISPILKEMIKDDIPEYYVIDEHAYLKLDANGNPVFMRPQKVINPGVPASTTYTWQTIGTSNGV